MFSASTHFSAPAPSLHLFSNFSLPVPRIVSYNVNSLSHYSTSSDLCLRRQLVTSCIRDVLPATDILCLQETNLATNETHALSGFPRCRVSLNNFRMREAGTAIIDSPTVLLFYDPVDIPLPPNLKGTFNLGAMSYSPAFPTFQRVP